MKYPWEKLGEAKRAIRWQGMFDPNEEERKGEKEGREVEAEVFLTAVRFYGRLGKAVKEPSVTLPRSVIGWEQPMATVAGCQRTAAGAIGQFHSMQMRSERPILVVTTLGRG